MITDTYDAVVMDLQMPVMGGLEACRRLREYETKMEDVRESKGEKHERLAVIGVSATVDGEVRLEALEAGMDFLLARPHSIQKLLDTISSVLGIKATRRSSISPMHVLIVDDSIPVLKTTRKALEVAGFTVSVASTGLEAIGLLRDTIYDAVVMDVRIPHMSGPEAVRVIRTHEKEEMKGETRHTFIIGVSTSTDTDAREEALDAGMDCFVVKSGHFTEMIRVLHSVGDSQGPGPATNGSHASSSYYGRK
jgi:two-component system, sensor histidine kinase and response regulator